MNVYVGMSGGVDSSVAAFLLQQQGHSVTGVFMKNWTADVGGWHCPWRNDYRDAKRVAMKLGIPLKLYDFQTEYKQKVIDYLLEEYKAGRTPNPDIMCNQEVKFKLYLETALEDGADMIATGHYAQIKNGNELHTALDESKDQSYFLSRVSGDALSKTLFPLGSMHKKDVRLLAKKQDLATANKKDSVGICFVGQVGIQEFIKEYISVKPGDLIDQNGIKVGTHDGALFYTIGQRHGMNTGGGLPYYVTGKDMDANVVYVTSDISDKKLWSNSINLDNLHWINEKPTKTDFKVRTRHLGKLLDAELVGDVLNFKEDIRAITPGQTAAFYCGSQLVGSGIIANQR